MSCNSSFRSPRFYISYRLPLSHSLKKTKRFSSFCVLCLLFSSIVVYLQEECTKNVNQNHLNAIHPALLSSLYVICIHGNMAYDMTWQHTIFYRTISGLLNLFFLCLCVCVSTLSFIIRLFARTLDKEEARICLCLCWR